MKTYKCAGKTVTASDDLGKWDCNCSIFLTLKSRALAIGTPLQACVHIAAVQSSVFGIKFDDGIGKLDDSKLRPDPKPDVQRAAPGARKLRD